jgi:hypothetical protein
MTPHDTINRYVAWQYTLGRGNTFTITVAVVAIVASVAISVITLRRNENAFEQSRIDARTDKLRAEVIDLISALSQRSSQTAIVVQRIKQLESVDRQAIQQNASATRPVDTTEAGKVGQATDTATKQLKFYALRKLGVTAYDEHGHPLNKLNILPPEQPST